MTIRAAFPSTVMAICLALQPTGDSFAQPASAATAAKQPLLPPAPLQNPNFPGITSVKWDFANGATVTCGISEDAGSGTTEKGAASRYIRDLDKVTFQLQASSKAPRLTAVIKGDQVVVVDGGAVSDPLKPEQAKLFLDGYAQIRGTCQSLTEQLKGLLPQMPNQTFAPNTSVTFPKPEGAKKTRGNAPKQAWEVYTRITAIGLNP
ncbi:MAG: hypothetical protein WAO98_10760 [Alphaproteobacteria bacterium]